MLFWTCMHHSVAQSDDARDSFYEELQHALDQFSEYHMKTLLRDYSAKLWVDILKPTIGNEILYKVSNDVWIRAVKFTTSRNLIVISTVLPHRNVLLMEKCTVKLITSLYIKYWVQYSWCSIFSRSWLWYSSLSGGCRSYGETISK
jgi:hypothetical protein